jgi:hypothetical protein
MGDRMSVCGWKQELLEAVTGRVLQIESQVAVLSIREEDNPATVR